MDKNLRDNCLRVLADSDKEGEALRDYVAEKIKELQDCTTIKGTPEQKSILLEGRQLAIQKLKEIFKKITPEKPILKQQKSKYT